MEHQNIQRLEHNGREIVLVGTAHVSRESADLVERVIREERPDAVCVELCQSRFDAIREGSKWQEMDIVKVIRAKRTSLLLSQLLMASFQRKIAQKFNIRPGEEMIRAIESAEAIGAQIVLADREIRVTLLRAWRLMGIWTKVKFLSEVLLSLLYAEEITEEEIEKLKQGDMLEVALQTVGAKMPRLKETLIDERDQYLAHRIGQVSHPKVVAVVGAGHIPGILQYMDKEIDMDALVQIPPERVWTKAFGWGFSIALMALFVAGFLRSGSQTSLNMVLWWSVITAGFASFGAMLMLAHPLTIIVSALAAPLATLHPLVATGWISGLTEASLRKPQVRDFLDLKDDITTLRGFFRNKITRILILVALVNLTTAIGTFLAIPVVMKFVL